MLVLSRKVGEEILIGDNISITVVKSQGGKVRIGISAPEEVAIRRAEIPANQARPAEEVPAGFKKVRMTPPQNAVLDCTSFV